MARRKAARTRPNILLVAIDSLRSDHMSCYGYDRLTTPHIDRFAGEGALFEQTLSAHIPTTPAYASMLSGLDCFGTQVVALRHRGGLPGQVRMLPEILRDAGYATCCVGFTGNPAARGFDQYLDYEAWGSWNAGRSPKAQNLNDVALPAMEKLARGDAPFFVMLRHMDPHAPYLPPAPYERMFYHGDERDRSNKSMKPVFAFKPFRDFFRSWLPPGITDKDYVVAQYDGAVAYMDACIRTILTQLEALGVLDDTIVVINGDHGETLYEHECWFDHHGLYEPTLTVPLIIRYPRKIPAGRRVCGFNQHKDLAPTLLDLAGVRPGLKFDGRSLRRLIDGRAASFESEIYITECTWMRKHGWRTPQWKLIVALEPDFHFKPEVELYDLVSDPLELTNVADRHRDVVAALRGRMEAYIARREQQTGNPNPMLTQGDWHGHDGVGPFKSCRKAYDTLHIGDPNAAARLQSRGRK